jgi:hypothetical protein
MAGSKKTFLDLLSSPLTLTPIVLGLGSALVLWAVSDKHHNLAAFLAVAGSLGGVGTLLTLLIVHAQGADPVLAQRRSELLAGLGDLADGGKFKPSSEAQQAASPAPAQRT